MHSGVRETTRQCEQKDVTYCLKKPFGYQSSNGPPTSRFIFLGLLMLTTRMSCCSYGPEAKATNSLETHVGNQSRVVLVVIR